MGAPTPNITLTEFPGQRPPVDCPGKLPETAQHLLAIRWVYGPGWFEQYLLSSNSIGTLWILWSRNDSGTDWGPWWEEAHPLAWCSREGVTGETAALVLVRAWWRNLRDRNQGYPGSLKEGAQLCKEEGFPDSGLLSYAAVAQLKEELWPGSTHDEAS